MCRTIRSLTLVALLCVSPLAHGQDVAKYALLVGVTHYNHAAMNEPIPLQFPEEDAKAVGSVLRTSGYTVDLLLGSDAKQTAIRSKLEALGSNGNQAGAVVVGFWGHGVEIQGTNDAMFCPFDTTLRLVLLLARENPRRKARVYVDVEI